MSENMIVKENPLKVPVESVEEDINIEHYQNYENMEDDIITDVEKPKKSLPNGLVTNLIISTVAQMGAKKYTEVEQKEEFIDRYTSFTTPWILALDIEGMLGDVNIQELSPATRITLCGIILIGGLYLSRIEEG